MHPKIKFTIEFFRLFIYFEQTDDGLLKSKDVVV
jgi:hypothetical protein